MNGHQFGLNPGGTIRRPALPVVRWGNPAQTTIPQLLGKRTASEALGEQQNRAAVGGSSAPMRGDTLAINGLSNLLLPTQLANPRLENLPRSGRHFTNDDVLASKTIFAADGLHAGSGGIFSGAIARHHLLPETMRSMESVDKSYLQLTLAAGRSAGYVPATIDKYAGFVAQAAYFATVMSVTLKPLNFVLLSLFCTYHQAIRRNTEAYVEQIVSGLCTVAKEENWGAERAHELVGWRVGSVVTDHEWHMLATARKGLGRLFPHEPYRKAPLGFAELKRIGTRLGVPGIAPTTLTSEQWAKANARDAELWLMCLLSFFGFLRSKELITLSFGHLTFYADALCASETEDGSKAKGVRLTLYDSKTSKGSVEAQHVYIAAREDGFDPLKWMIIHLRKCEPLYRSDPSTHMFAYNRAKGTGGLWDKSRWRNELKALLVRAGFGFAEVERYGTHSFRAGGATDALMSGVPLEAVIQQGRWRSDAWKLYHRSGPEALRVWGGFKIPERFEAVKGFRLAA